MDNLTNTIKNITLYYIKKHYLKYLKDNNLDRIENDTIKELVSDFYHNKDMEIKTYIRSTMKKNFPDYSTNFALKTGTEEIILEMFEDSEFSISKVVLEIENFQNYKKN